MRMRPTFRLAPEMLRSGSHLAGSAILAVLAAPVPAVAQPSGAMVHGSMPEHPMAEPAAPLGVAENRDASGTSWQPDSTPMFMWHATIGGWAIGLHENVFVGFDDQMGTRGDDRFISTNWVMAMARHAIRSGD